MMNTASLILLLGLFSCVTENTPEKDPVSAPKKKVYPDECSKFYWFNNELIDLELLESIVVDGFPATDFKQCSKYAHRFESTLNDTVIINETTWVLDIDNKKINIFSIPKIKTVLQAFTSYLLPNLFPKFMNTEEI